MPQYLMKINDISGECMSWLCNYLNCIKLIGNITCVNGGSIIRNGTLRLNRKMT